MMRKIKVVFLQTRQHDRFRDFLSKEAPGRRPRRALGREWSSYLFIFSEARRVIRFLLERNISHRRSRCVNSLIRGDKYRRDTSPPNNPCARGPAATIVGK